MLPCHVKVILHVRTFCFIGKFGCSLPSTLSLCFPCLCAAWKGSIDCCCVASNSSDKSKAKSGDQKVIWFKKCIFQIISDQYDLNYIHSKTFKSKFRGCYTSLFKIVKLPEKRWLRKKEALLWLWPFWFLHCVFLIHHPFFVRMYCRYCDPPTPQKKKELLGHSVLTCVKN